MNREVALEGQMYRPNRDVRGRQIIGIPSEAFYSYEAAAKDLIEHGSSLPCDICVVCVVRPPASTAGNGQGKRPDTWTESGQTPILTRNLLVAAIRALPEERLVAAKDASRYVWP
jgi:hypothetical protein